MNNYSMIYSQFGCCGNRQISAKYVVDNWVMCENRVNTHSHRAYFTENILNVKGLAIPFCIILTAVQHYWSKFHTAFLVPNFSGFANRFLRLISTQWCSAPPCGGPRSIASSYYGVTSRHSPCYVGNAVFFFGK